MEHFVFFYSKRLHEDTISQLTLIENVESWNTDSMLPFLCIPSILYDLCECMSRADIRTDFAVDSYSLFPPSHRSVMFYMHGPIFVRMNFADFYNRLTFCFLHKMEKFFFGLVLAGEQNFVWWIQTSICLKFVEDKIFLTESMEICFARFFAATKTSNFLFCFWMMIMNSSFQNTWWTYLMTDYSTIQ